MSRRVDLQGLAGRGELLQYGGRSFRGGGPHYGQDWTSATIGLQQR